MVADGDTKLKELLYRAEAERLQLQQQAAGLADDKQQLTADVYALQQQLADLHTAFSDSQQQVVQLSATCATLQVQVTSATHEYRANDIIAIGLRDHITRLQQQLQDSQEFCGQQTKEIARNEENIAALQECKADLLSQLKELRQQHQELQSQHASANQRLAQAQDELQDMQKRWSTEHGDQARQIQALLEQRQQLDCRLANTEHALSQAQQQSSVLHERCIELETELGSIRELVIVLGKAMGRHAGQQLPSHDDPVWQKLGPLGGVHHALDVVIKHTREMLVRVRDTQGEFDRLEDRIRAESAQKADLQSELYDVRTLYAKAVSVREALEARTTRAEAERNAAEANWQQAKAQATEDATHISELQELVASLTKQVEQLQPLQPKLASTQVERDTAVHKLERLQEQCDQLQRQLQQALTHEAGMQVEVDAYKTEHTQLLSANAQMLEQCTSLNKQVQLLEINAREGNLAVGQLEEAKRKLQRTKTQLQAMTDRHSEVLNRLETTRELLGTSTSGAVGMGDEPGGSGRSSRAQSAWRGTQAGVARLQLRSRSGAGLPGASSPRSSLTAGVRAIQAANSLAGQPASPGGTARSSSTATGDAEQAGTGASAAGVSNAEEGNVVVVDDEDGAGAGLQRSVSAELDALLHTRKLEQLTENQQQAIMELEDQLLVRDEVEAQLELQLVKLEADHLQQLQDREQAVSKQCMEAAAEATEALRFALGSLQSTVASLHQPAAEPASSSDAAKSSSAGTDMDIQQEQQLQRRGWLHDTLHAMQDQLEAVVAEARARAAMIAARQHVGVQSDEPLHSQWLRFLSALPEAAVEHPLNLKAATEAIIRVYLRALNLMEAQELHRHQGMAAAATGAVGGGALTVFDVLMAHYSQQQQQHHHHQHQSPRLSVVPHDASLWKDPQGPVTRLLVSCRELAPSSVKASLFCCLAGTHTPSRHAWGVQHWRQFLLLLHAAKLLTGGTWKGVLRDWASAAGALLPLQCVLDLLGNVYNTNSPAALEHQPAVLGSRQQLLQAIATVPQPRPVSATSARPASAVPRPSPASADGTASNAPSEPSPGAKASQASSSVANTIGSYPDSSSRGHSSGSSRPSSSSSLLQRGSVSAAFRELIVDGPLGPATAVNLDDLLGMLMMQFDAGLLPLHPLLQPRRLTTGDLGNATNAWGSAATEAAAAAAGMLSTHIVSPRALLAGLTAADAGDGVGRSGDYGFLPGAPSGLSSTGGWLSSRPTTAGAASDRAGSTSSGTPIQSARGGGNPALMVSGNAGASNSGSGVVLPRIRTPDGQGRDLQVRDVQGIASSSGMHIRGSAAGSAAGTTAGAVSASKQQHRSSSKGGLVATRAVSFTEPATK